MPPSSRLPVVCFAESQDPFGAYPLSLQSRCARTAGDPPPNLRLASAVWPWEPRSAFRLCFNRQIALCSASNHRPLSDHFLCAVPGSQSRVCRVSRIEACLLCPSFPARKASRWRSLRMMAERELQKIGADFGREGHSAWLPQNKRSEMVRRGPELCSSSHRLC